VVLWAKQSEPASARVTSVEMNEQRLASLFFFIEAPV